jgi:predicted nuclease of predicted toxin-antitoxin system
MRWLADECVAAPLVAQLRAAGHDVLYVAESEPRASDIEVLALAHAVNRLLLTDDKDFGELVFRQGRPVPGVVLLRLAPGSSTTRLARLQVAIDQFGDALFGRYTVVGETRVRSRSLPAR